MRVLQQQLSKYIHNIELEELGLMGGDVVLENLGAGRVQRTERARHIHLYGS